MKLGSTNVKQAMILLATLANAGDAIGHETGWKERATEILALLPLMKTVGTIDFKQVIPEFNDLDAVEREEILKAFNENFKIHDGKLEGSIEKGLSAVMDLIAAGGKVMEFVNDLKSQSSDQAPAIDVGSAQVASSASGEMEPGANQAALNSPKASV